MKTSFPGSFSYPWRSQPCSSHFCLIFFRDESAIFRALYDACLALLPIFPEQSWVLEWIRMRVGYVPERANSIWIRIRVDVEIFESAKKICGLKNIRIRTIRQRLRLKVLCMYARRNNSKTISDLTPFAQFITSNVRIQNHIVNWDTS